MNRSILYLLLVSFSFAIASAGSWYRAYSPLSCYEALPRSTEWPPAVCDPRFDLTFVFIKDSVANIIAVLGAPAAIMALVLALTWQLILRARVGLATAFSFLAFLALWAFLIWWFDHSPYQCAFGFGGFGCSGVIENFGLNAVFLGWVAPLVALICTPVVGRLTRKKRNSHISK